MSIEAPVVKRPRGRPRKYPLPATTNGTSNDVHTDTPEVAVKRRPGRPKKDATADVTGIAVVKKPRGRPRLADAAPRPQVEVTVALREEMTKVRTDLDKLNEQEIELYRSIGERLNTIVDDGTGKYGKQPEKAMYQVMPLGRDSLRPMMVLARTYSADEVRRLSTLRNKETEERLTWTHVSALMRIKDKAKAMTLAEKAVESGWSARELVKNVIKTAGGPRSKGARPMKKARSLEEVNEDIRDKSQNWLNTAEKRWLTEGGVVDLFAAELAKKRPTQSTVDDMDRTITIVEELIVTARQVTHQLNALRGQANAARQTRSVL